MIDELPLAAAKTHALAVFPQEAAGIVVRTAQGQLYRPCRNVAVRPERDFVIPGEDYADAEDAGEIVAIVHSHPNGTARASHVDRMSCEQWGHPFGIITLGGDPVHLGDVGWVQPEGWRAPLVGREFHYGVLDCYTLIRDYYAWELGITLPEFDHGPDCWWDRKHANYRAGFSPYLQHFASAGFVEASGALQVGDIVLMQIRADEPNHAGVYIGDEIMLHHLYNRLSDRVIYGGYFADVTRKIIRRRA